MASGSIPGTGRVGAKITGNGPGRVVGQDQSAQFVRAARDERAAVVSAPGPPAAGARPDVVCAAPVKVQIRQPCVTGPPPAPDPVGRPLFPTQSSPPLP